KMINTFEGGAVTTDDDELADKMRLMRNFGFSGRDNVKYIGSNGKMPEVSAAMGLTSLESADEFLEANRANYERYRELLRGVPGVTVMEFAPNDRNNLHYVVL